MIVKYTQNRLILRNYSKSKRIYDNIYNFKRISFIIYLSDKRLPVYGKGINVRDWLYVEDHCKAVDMIIRNGKVGEIYNVGGHNEMCNLDIVKVICKALGKKEDLIEFVKDRKGHDLRYAINPEKIRKELGWYPETSFNEGIKKTIEWYLEKIK